MRLQRAIFVELSRNLLLIGTGIGFATLVGIVVSATYRARGATLLQTLELVPLLGAGLVPHLLPLVFLIALVQTYGRLSAERELIAIRMAGVHLARLLSPAILLAGLLAIVIFVFKGTIEPEMRRRQGEIAKRIAATVLHPKSSGINELSFATRDRDGSSAFYMSWADRNPDGTFNNLFLSYHDGNSQRQARAKEAKLERYEYPDGRAQITLKLVQVSYVDGKGTQTEASGDITREIVVPVRLRETYAPTSELHARVSANERTPLPEAKTKEERQAVRREQRARLRIENEIYSREAEALTPLLFACLGMPIAILLRTRARLAIFLAAAGIALLGYYPLTYIGSGLASEAMVSPWMGAFGPLLILGALSAALLRRAFRV